MTQQIDLPVLRDLGVLRALNLAQPQCPANKQDALAAINVTLAAISQTLDALRTGQDALQVGQDVLQAGQDALQAGQDEVSIQLLHTTSV